MKTTSKRSKPNGTLSIASLSSRLLTLVIASGMGLSALAQETKPGPPEKSAAETAAPHIVHPLGPVQYIDTSFENASPLWYEAAADGSLQIHLIYDQEYASPNRAALHFHFRIQATPGADIVLEFNNLFNVWNGRSSQVSQELRRAVVSEDGVTWNSLPVERLEGNRSRLKVKMQGSSLYVARVEPYRLSDLDKMLASVKDHPLVELTPIGKTVEGRPLEILKIGDEAAPYRLFLRARAHPWESGGNWVIEGLLKKLLKGDEEARKHLARYCIYILPMANKDGVARGNSRFNLRGKDLNRDWGAPADPHLAPENYSLEKWLQEKILAGKKPHLALELHNDGRGLLHISRPPIENLDQHLERMTILEKLLREHTWFTEGTTRSTFTNAGTLGEGWLLRYGIDAVVHEFNCNWIAGLSDYPSAAHWKTYGENLPTVFSEYFDSVKPQ